MKTSVAIDGAAQNEISGREKIPVRRGMEQENSDLGKGTSVPRVPVTWRIRPSGKNRAGWRKSPTAYARDVVAHRKMKMPVPRT